MLEHTPVRRLVTIPTVLGVFVLLGLLFPLAALVSDPLGRRPLIALRTLAMVELYSACEAMALAMSALIWATPSSEEQSRRRYLTLQRWWAAVLLGGAIRLFSLRIDFDEGDAARGAGRGARGAGRGARGGWIWITW